MLRDKHIAKKKPKTYTTAQQSLFFININERINKYTWECGFLLQHEESVGDKNKVPVTDIKI